MPKNCNSSFIDGNSIIGIPNCNKWKMIAICTFLHFGGAPTLTRVPIFWTCSVVNALSIRLCTEFWSQYHSPFFTFKEGKAVRVSFHPWCLFILSSFASSISSLLFTLEQIIYQTLSNVPSPSRSCWDHGYFATIYFGANHISNFVKCTIPFTVMLRPWVFCCPIFLKSEPRPSTRSEKQKKPKIMHNLDSSTLWITLFPKKYSQGLGFKYLLFGKFCFFVGGSCEVGSNWVSDCSWKPSKLLVPPLEGALIHRCSHQQVWAQNGVHI